MVVMVCAMSVVVIVLQVLRYFAYPLARRRRGFARPLDAAALSRRLAHIVEGKERRVLRHVETLRERGEHELAYLAAVPALAVARDFFDFLPVGGQGLERGPLHRELGERVLQDIGDR